MAFPPPGMRPPIKPPKNECARYKEMWEELSEGLSVLGKFYGDVGRCAEATIRDKMDDLERKYIKRG